MKSKAIFLFRAILFGLALAFLSGAADLAAQAQSGPSGDYRVELAYTTRDFATSRRVFVELVGRSGRFTSLTTGDGTRLDAVALINTTQLTQFLAELGSIGGARSEKLEALNSPGSPPGFSVVHLRLDALPVGDAAGSPAGAWPNFLEAFSGLGRFLAGLAYVLIWMAPLWVLLALLFWKRRVIFDGLRDAGRKTGRLLETMRGGPSQQ